MPPLNLIRNSALYLSFFLITANNFVYGQAPAIEWQKCFGSYDGDYCNSMLVTLDGGYIMAGYTEGVDGGDVMGYHGEQGWADIWLVKTDNKGNIQWQKCLGGKYFELGTSIYQTNDGGYILAGSSYLHDCGTAANQVYSADFWVVKLNNKGDIIWQKMYGGSNTDNANAIDPASDGGYIVAGFEQSIDGDVTNNHGNRDYWIIKIDASGNLKWQKSLGGSGDDEILSMKATPDGGCIAAGFTESNDGDVTGYHGNKDGWIVKLDNKGNLQWKKTLGGSLHDEISSVQLTSDGGYIMAGVSASNDGDVSGNHQSLGKSSDFWIVKVNSTGNIQWQKCYGGNYNEAAYFILPVSDGGYLVSGDAESADGDLTCNNGKNDEWIIKIDHAGNLQWQKSMGGSEMDKAECIRPLTDGGYIVAGTTCSPDVQGYHSVTGPNTCGDFWLVMLSAPVTVSPKTVIKINSASATGCAGSPLTITASALYAGINPIYQWKRNGIAVGSDSPVYTDSNFADNDIVICSVTAVRDCDIIPALASDTVTVKLKTNTIHPEITITATSTVLCPCTDIIFKATVGNGGASPIYQWLLNGTKTGNNTSVYINNLLKDGDVITCVYSDNTSCVADGSVISNNIQINDTSSNASSVIISASADTICAGTTVTFNANPVNAGANPVYQWTLNNTNAGDNSPTFSSNNLSDGDQVSCLLTIINPCLSLSVNSNILSMTVSSPVIQITPQDTLINVGGQLQLNGIISGSISSFQWAPADQLENPNVLSPTTIPVMDNTTYTLTAAGDDGCVASKSVIVKIVKGFYMPNAFTPNGDGKNDVFRIPPAISLKLKEFSIYDQWGTKVFSTENISTGWDGTINGKQQATGVYVYIIKGTNEKGSVFLKGNFILIR